MIDMSTWEDITVDVVTELHLDPRNVRIEQPEGVPEADIIQDLFATEKTLSLVEGIVSVGFLTHELPIAIRRDNKLVVVEGNRRLAALKAIQNPYLVPTYQARVTKLTQTVNDVSPLRQINVKIAPNQDHADQLIAALHTGNQRVRWTPARQAAFFQAQIDAGKTPAELIAQYPTVDVKKFIIRSKILNLFRSVSYRDPALADYIEHRNFPVSTLARLYTYDRFLGLAQIEVNYEQADISLKSSMAEFERIAEKIISDIHEKRINTRILNSTSNDSFKMYMDELRHLVDECSTNSGNGETKTQPNESSGNSEKPSPPPGDDGTRGTRSSSQGSSSGNATTPNGEKAKDSGKSKPKKGPFLATDQLAVPSSFPRPVHATLLEISNLNIQRFPNAGIDLLRTFLEKTIKAYAESCNEEIKNTGNEKGFVFLQHCLIWLEQHLKAARKTAYIQVVNKIKDGRVNGYVASMDHLNAVNHNHHIGATPDEVRECWETMEGLLRVMLRP